jgi:hypothetical protein
MDLTFTDYESQMLLLNSRDHSLQRQEELLEHYLDVVRQERTLIDQRRVKLQRLWTNQNLKGL